MGLNFKLHAKNSSGNQDLYFDYDKKDNSIRACIIGRYKGENIQIDFDSLNKREFQEFTDFVNLMNCKLK